MSNIFFDDLAEEKPEPISKKKVKTYKDLKKMENIKISL